MSEQTNADAWASASPFARVLAIMVVVASVWGGLLLLAAFVATVAAVGVRVFHWLAG